MNKMKLERKITLTQATAINMIDMVGIGPFIVISLVAEKMGSSFLYAWLAGAFLSLIDACVWSQLGVAFPLAGGSFQFLKISYGDKWGKFFSFLYVWQTLIQAPLVIASASIGFAQYLGYIIPLNFYVSKLISVSIILLIVLLLYRKIETIGKLSILLWIGVLSTLAWIIGTGFFHGNMLQPILHINDGFQFNSVFAGALGFATVKTVYSYLGYYNVCHLGGEIILPEKNIPRSMFVSILAITILYLLMNLSVASVLPLHQIQTSKFVVSEYIQTISGHSAATIVTILILWVAFASLFAATLGYSRVPYAAAADGAFFSIFAKLHPTKNFPYISLLFLASLAIIFSWTLNLKQIIPAILAMRILVQFIGQSVGLLILAKRKGKQFFTWRMPLYPLPVILAIIMWTAIFISTGRNMMLAGTATIGVGCLVFMAKEFYLKRKRPSLTN